MLDPGWAADESFGTWTDGSMSRLAFRLPEPEHETFLSVDLSPYTEPRRGLARQSLEVRVNGSRLQTSSTFISERTVMLFPVDRRVFLEHPITIVSLVLPDAQSPASLRPDSHDGRRLAVCIKALRWSDIWYDYPCGQRIVTDQTSPSNRYLLYGWSHPEPEFIWTDGPTAVMLLRLRTEKAVPLRFRAKIRIFWPAPDLAPLVIALFANGRRAGEAAVHGADAYWIEIPISPDCQREDGLLFLRFAIQPPRSPRDFGLPDDRQLGFALSEFVVGPASPTKTVADSCSRHRSLSQAVSDEFIWGRESNECEATFYHPGLSAAKLIYGWGEPDLKGIPICRETAILALDLSAYSDARTRMECILRYSSVSTGGAKVRVFINENPAGEWDVKPEQTVYSLTVWPAMLQAAASTYVRFELGVSERVDHSLVLQGIRLSSLAPQLRELVELTPGQVIRFDEGAPADDILGHGWAWKDGQGVRSHGSESTLLFRFPPQYLPGSLQLELNPSDPECWPMGWQHFIEVNGRAASHLDLRAAQIAIFDILPEDLLHREAVEIRFTAVPLQVAAQLVAAGLGPELDQTVLKIAFENPAIGIYKAAATLAGQGVPVSEELVRHIWSRYDLSTFRKRVGAIEVNKGFAKLDAPSGLSFTLRAMTLQVAGGVRSCDS